MHRQDFHLRRPHGLAVGSKIDREFIDASCVMHKLNGTGTVCVIQRLDRWVDVVTITW